MEFGFEAFILSGIVISCQTGESIAAYIYIVFGITTLEISKKLSQEKIFVLSYHIVLNDPNHVEAIYANIDFYN